MMSFRRFQFDDNRFGNYQIKPEAGIKSKTTIIDWYSYLSLKCYFAALHLVTQTHFIH